MLAENLAHLLGGDAAAQAAIAEKVGVTQPTISKWSRLSVTGSASEPEFRKMARLARVLGVSLDDLAWSNLKHGPSLGPSQSPGSDEATMAQALELVYLLADARPEDPRFRRPTWATLRTAAKAIKLAEGNQRGAMAQFLKELAEEI